MGWEGNIGGREGTIKTRHKHKGNADLIKKRDKGWRVAKNKDKKYQEDIDIISEHLRLQGLIRCIDCDLPYSIELTECPHCIKNDKSSSKN